MAINKALRKDDGRVTNVPKKLEAGMTVVVWLKPDYYLFGWELGAGIVTGKWLKGKIDVVNDIATSVEIDGRKISWLNTTKSNVIIIRSVALEDTKTPAQVARTIRTNAAKQRRRLESKKAQ